MQKTLLILCVIGGIALIWLASSTTTRITPSRQGQAQTQAVRMENGVQIIHIVARGGYTPDRVIATGGIPTKLEIETTGSFDCSLSFTIPSLGYRKMLPSRGTTLIDIPIQQSGTTLIATCAMGMYSLTMQFN